MKKKRTSNFNSIFVSLIVLILFAVLVAAAVPTFSISETNSTVTEDVLFTYNFTANVTWDGSYSPMVFSISEINSDSHTSTNASDYYWISINSSSGVMTINSTLDNETGNLNISVYVKNSNSPPGGTTDRFFFNISSINDKPKFQNLGANRTLDKSLFSLMLYATDEELDNNFTFNVSVKTCPGGGTACQLFNLTYFNATATNISFTPSIEQNGTFEINFSVKDNRSSGYYSEYWNWTIAWNYDPYFTYVCNNERDSAVENTEFTCWVNASDPDETTSLNFTANYTWLTFNGTTLSSTIKIPLTATNASALVNFTANDSMVGNWSVNISLADTSSLTGRNSTLVYFYVSNVNDTVYLDEIANQTSYNSSTFSIYFNASDEDNLVPDKNVFNETLEFYTNNSNFSFVSREVISGTNITQARFTYNGTQMGAGNYTVKVWVNDSNNFSSSMQIFTIQILANTMSVWGVVETNYSLVENTNFFLNLSSNVTDADVGDTITFSHSNDTSFASFLINETTAVINFTPTDADVGHHIVTITATDGKTPISLDFNFTVNNTNDNPIIDEPLTTSPAGARIDSASNMNFTKSSASTITLEVWDGDLAIPSGQSSFYSENLTLNLTIAGPNSALFSFGSPLAITGKTNKTRFVASFTPTSTGDYNITINITDATNLSDMIRFNLSVSQGAVETVTTTVPTSGGGGSDDIPVALKIIIPGPVSSKKRDKIILPVQLYNSGKTTLREIVLSGKVAKNGILRNEIIASFDQSTFTSLAVGERKNLTLIVDVNTEEIGLYEVTINASVKSPKYEDWGKIYLTVEEGEKIEEKLVFTEEYVIGNPECAELKELVDEAKALAERGDTEGAARKLNEALEACKQAISQKSILTGWTLKSFEENAISYTAIGSLIAAVLGFAYYQYRRIRLKREVLTGVKENIS
ncbi:hypothetical protein J4402_05245 [Candidatus Pacearchaeota archaeon]|nr:hypothetical protein [Candidatus Pacearchaeota archaeon]